MENNSFVGKEADSYERKQNPQIDYRSPKFWSSGDKRGVFSSHAASPVLMAFGLSDGHLIYGFILGKLIGEAVISERDQAEIRLEEEAPVESQA